MAELLLVSCPAWLGLLYPTATLSLHILPYPHLPICSYSRGALSSLAENTLEALGFVLLLVSRRGTVGSGDQCYGNFTASTCKPPQGPRYLVLYTTENKIFCKFTGLDLTNCGFKI